MKILIVIALVLLAINATLEIVYEGSPNVRKSKHALYFNVTGIISGSILMAGSLLYLFA